VNAWIEAYSLLHLLRMRHHQERRAASEPLDNRLKPETLNPLDARILRESFRQAQRLQQVLALTWQL
jgi:CBS domain-containing protein